MRADGLSNLESELQARVLFSKTMSQEIAIMCLSGLEKSANASVMGGISFGVGVMVYPGT